MGSSIAHSRENATTNFCRLSDFRSYYKLKGIIVDDDGSIIDCKRAGYFL